MLAGGDDVDTVGGGGVLGAVGSLEHAARTRGREKRRGMSRRIDLENGKSGLFATPSQGQFQPSYTALAFSVPERSSQVG